MTIYTIIASTIAIVFVALGSILPGFPMKYGINPRLFGLLGILLLWITLMIKPLFGILTRGIKAIKAKGHTCPVGSALQKAVAWALKYRRGFGITTFLLILMHGGIFLTMWISNNWRAMQSKKAFAIAGMFGLAMLLVGYLTSNDYSMRLLKKNWKKVQMVAYLGLIGGSAHILFINFEKNYWILILIVIYLVLKVWDFLASRKKKK